MSKKHFEAIAAIIRGRVGELVTNPAAGFDEGYNTGKEVALEAVAYDLANYFASESPRFDRDRFMAACGL